MSIRTVIVLVAAASIAGCGNARQIESAAGGDAALARCTECHGTYGNGNAAPPRALDGATATTDPGVGAHQAHVKPSAIRQAVDCVECHVVPQNVSDPGHIDNPTATLTWGALASARGVTPTPAAGPADRSGITCTNYCHGAAFTADNGTLHAPVWTKVDGSQAGCGTCHGIPPPPPHPLAANQTACAACHPRTIRPDGTIDVAGGYHINGAVDLAGSGGSTCTSCHGDPNRANADIAAAPPRGIDGSTDPSSPLVGAHQAHLNAGQYANAFACTECHVVPTDTQHATQGLQLTFGPIATAYGSPASFSQTALTCTVYCHGTAAWGGTLHAPVWNQGASQGACGTCHGIPSSAGKHLLSQHTSIISSCATCHGTFGVATHVNGVKNIVVGTAITSWTASSSTCTASCHSSPTEVRTW